MVNGMQPRNSALAIARRTDDGGAIRRRWIILMVVFASFWLSLQFHSSWLHHQLSDSWSWSSGIFCFEAGGFLPSLPSQLIGVKIQTKHCFIRFACPWQRRITRRFTAWWRQHQCLAKAHCSLGCFSSSPILFAARTAYRLNVACVRARRLEIGRSVFN